MQLGDLAQSIKQGIAVETSNLTNVPTNYLYLQAQNIKSGFITEENVKYILEKTGKKYTKADMLEYGDILVYHKDGQFFDIFRFTQDFTKKIIPSPAFAIIKGANSFLTNILQLESGKSYVKSELEDINKRQENNWLKVIISIKNIDIPLSFDEEDISISPGNIPVPEEDFAKINVREAFITVDNLIKRVNLNELRTDGYFQRTSGLWRNDVKSRLIETLIVRIPIPPLYFDIADDNNWLVVDGLQRINAITEFSANKLQLEGLDYLPRLNGLYYKDLDRPLQRKFEEAQLATFIIQKGTPRSVRYKIFRSINTSALVLKRQEIRHAINEDEQIDGFTPSRYVRELAMILNQYKSVPNKEKERMYDCELALRYVAFRIFFYKEYSGGTIADFLDKTMESMYSYPKNKLEIYKEDFGVILKLLTQIFDTIPLFTHRMIDTTQSNDIRGSLVEIWTYAVAQLSDDDKKRLQNKAETVRKKTRELKGNELFLRSIDPRYNNTAEMVKIRFSTILNLINDTLNDN